MEKEVENFELVFYVEKGRFLVIIDESKIVVGKKLVKIFNVGVGDELIVVVEVVDGLIGVEFYEVVGILKLVVDGVDCSVVFMNEFDYCNFFSLYGD